MQRTTHSFIKNEKELKNAAFFWKEQMPNPAQYYIYTLNKGCLDSEPARLEHFAGSDQLFNNIHMRDMHTYSVKFWILSRVTTE